MSESTGEPHVHFWMRDLTQPVVDTNPPIYSWECSCGARGEGASRPGTSLSWGEQMGEGQLIVDDDAPPLVIRAGRTDATDEELA